MDLVGTEPEKTAPIAPPPSTSLTTSVMASLLNVLIIPFEKEEVEETKTPEQVEKALRSAVSSVVQCLQDIRQDRIKPGLFTVSLYHRPLHT